MSKKNLIIRGVLIGALAAYLFVPAVRAGSVSAILYTDQIKEATWPLHRDGVNNGKDQFKIAGQVLSSSKYDVRYYYGNCPETWGDGNIDKYSLDEIRVILVGKGKTVDKVITRKMCGGNFIKVVMYGNSKAEPKKQCRANVLIYNY